MMKNSGSKTKSDNQTARISKKKREKVIMTQTIEIIPVKLEKNGEAIVGLIIEKLLNKAVRKSNTNKIEKRIGEYCFNRAKGIFSSLNRLINITHDNDNCSDCVTITQPPKPLKERGISTYIAVINESAKQKKLNTNVNSDNNPTAYNMESFYHFERGLNRELHRSSNRLISFLSPGISTLTLIKKKSLAPLDLVIGDISNINKNHQESEEIIKLRHDKLIQMSSQEEEERKKKDKQKRLEELALIKLANAKNSKPFNSDSLTFDTNGTLIQLKKITLEKLPTDFKALKVNVKDLKTKTESNQPLITSTLIKKKTQIKSLLTMTQTDNQLSQDQMPLLMNNREHEQSKVQYKTQSYPSGNNFDIIVPSTGVIIKSELNKSKSGDMNYHSKYKKYSIQDYQKLITECSSPMLHNTIMFKGINQSSISQDKHSESNMPELISEDSFRTNQKWNRKLLPLKATKSSGLLFNFKKASSPLLSGDNVMKIKNNAALSLKASLNSIDNEEVYSYNNKFKEKSHNYKLSSVNIFKTNQHSLLTSKNNSRQSSHDREGCNLEFINVNQFNKEILNQKGWGMSGIKAKAYKPNTNNLNIKYPIKPDFKTEVDLKIRDVKMPRERRFHKRLNKSKSLFNM